MLFQPSNITPSTLAGFNSQTVLTNDYITVSWQVNGNSAMTQYSIGFRRVSDDGSISSTDTYRITRTPNLPEYATSENGEPNIYTHSENITWGSRLTAGTYALSITQYWAENGATKSVEQYSPTIFYVRAKPTVTSNIFINNDFSIDGRYTYSQAQGDTVEWVRWVLYKAIRRGEAIYIPVEIVYDSGILYSQNPEMNNIFTANVDETYGLQVTVCTNKGIIATSEWSYGTFPTPYAEAQVSGVVGKCEKNYYSIEYNIGEYNPSVAANLLGAPSEESKYYVENHQLHIENGEIVWGVASTATTFTINMRLNLDGLAWGYYRSSTDNNFGFTLLDLGGFLIELYKYYNFNSRDYVIYISYRDKNDNRGGGGPVFYNNPSTVSLGFINLGIAYNPSESKIKFYYSFDGDQSQYVTNIIGIENATTSELSGVTLLPIDAGDDKQNGEIVLDYIHIMQGDHSNEWTGNFAMDWSDKPFMYEGDTTIFCANFILGMGQELQAGDIWDWAEELNSYIYRTVNGKSKFLLNTTNSRIRENFPFVRLKDYSIPSNSKVSYKVIQIDTDEVVEYNVIGETETQHVAYDHYLLIEAEQHRYSDIYLVKKTWRFGNNIATGAISNNNSPQLQSNFTGYRFKQPTSQIGKSGTLQALLSNVKDCDYNDTVEEMEALFNASLSNNHFFLKDIKGNIYKVNISAPITQTINTKTAKQQVTISLAWEESGSAKDAVIVEIE